MKFYHLSDILIGNSFESGMRWEETRNREIGESLRRLLDEAEREGVQLILIGGGLFARPPLTGELREIGALFQEHPGIEAVVAQGRSDAIAMSAPLLSFTPPDNLHFVLGPGVERIELPSLDTTVYAASARIGSDGRVSYPGADAFTGDSSGERIRIALLPELGDDEISACFGARGDDWSYVAAAGRCEGTSHEIIRNLCYRPGCFEPRDSSDRGAHGAMLGEISPDTGRLTKIDFVPLALASYVTLTITVTPRSDAGAIASAIEAEMGRRRSTNIYRLRITGEKDPGMVPDLASLREKYRIREVIDEAIPRYDYEALYHEHSQDIIGYYIATIAMAKRDMSALEKKAMFYGLDALLRTAKET